MCNITAKEDAVGGPWLLRQLQNFYYASPKLYIPFTKLDIGFSLVCASLFWVVRLLAESVMIQHFNWPSSTKEELTKTQQMACGFASCVHSLSLVPSLYFILTSQPYIPSAKISTSPLWYQTSVSAALQLCIGYMIYDSFASFVILKWDSELGYPVLTDEDYMFLAHHAITTVYMMSVRILGSGHISAMICMFLGEFTNPFHNLFLISEVAQKLACCSGGQFSTTFHSTIEFSFSFLYVLFRAVIAPPFLIHLTYDLLFTESGRKNIGIIICIIMVLLVWAIEIGSIDWIKDCYGMLRKYLPTLPSIGSNDEL